MIKCIGKNKHTEYAVKDNKNNKRFKMLNIARDGKGLSKAPENRSGFKRFFRTLFDNFGKIVSVNIFMVLGNFPVIFLIAVFSGYTKLSALIPMTDVFQNLDGIIAADGITPFKMTLYAVEGLQNNILISTPLTYVFYALGALTLFTFGLVNVGTAYILRNIAKGDPVFVWSDFWYAVKRNWKQALPFGIADVLINVILLYNVYTLSTGTDFMASMLFWSNIVIFAVYFCMRFYIYVQMLTFKLSIFKILKNSLIFSLVGFKRNILAVLGIAFGVLVEVALLFGFGGLLMPFAIAAPLALLFSAFAYMKVYAAYFKIEEIMIIPYKMEHPELYPEEDESSDAIMVDDVTERERLERLKAEHKNFDI